MIAVQWIAMGYDVNRSPSESISPINMKYCTERPPRVSGMQSYKGGARTNDQDGCQAFLYNLAHPIQSHLVIMVSVYSLVHSV